MRYGTWFLFQSLATLFCLIQVTNVQGREISHYTRVSRMTPPKTKDDIVDQGKGPVFYTRVTRESGSKLKKGSADPFLYTRVARNAPSNGFEERRGLRSRAIKDFCRRTSEPSSIPNTFNVDPYPKALIMDYRDRRNVMAESAAHKVGFNADSNSDMILRSLLCNGNEQSLGITRPPPLNRFDGLLDDWNMVENKRNGKSPQGTGANQTPFLILRKYAK